MCIVHIYSTCVSSIYTVHVDSPYIHYRWIVHIYSICVSSIYTVYVYRPYVQYMCIVHIYSICVSSIYTVKVYRPHIQYMCIVHIYSICVSSTYTLQVYRPHIQYMCIIHWICWATSKTWNKRPAPADKQGHHGYMREVHAHIETILDLLTRNNIYYIERMENLKSWQSRYQYICIVNLVEMLNWVAHSD